MGYTLTYVATGPEDVMQRIDDAFAYDHAEGVVLLGTDLEENIIDRIHKNYERLVIVDTWFPLITGAEFVVMNNFAGGAAAADHLISLGHSKIGYVQSDVRVHNFCERRQGFFRALGRHGVHQKEVRTYTVVSNVAKAEEEFASILSSPGTELPTALFCESDYIAIGVLRALKKSGTRVPADVSIVGFDDISQARIVLPELTTIHVDRQLMAEIALERLQEIVSGGATTTRKTIVDTYLVTRESCTAVQPDSKECLTKESRTFAATEE